MNLSQIETEPIEPEPIDPEAIDPEETQNKPSEAMNLGHLASTTFKRVNPRGAPNLADRAKKRKLESQESERNKIKLIEENRLTIKKCLNQLVENASDAYLDRVIDKEIQFEEKHLIVDPTLVDQKTAALVKNTHTHIIAFLSCFPHVYLIMHSVFIY